jgi:hypothetical protein
MKVVLELTGDQPRMLLNLVRWEALITRNALNALRTVEIHWHSYEREKLLNNESQLTTIGNTLADLMGRNK